MEICGKREMELLEKIGFTRIAGSPEEEKAAQILKAECDAIGVPAIIEPFEIEQGIVEEATLEILEPFQQEYPVTGYQCAENTPEGALPRSLSMWRTPPTWICRTSRGRLCWSTALCGCPCIKS